MGMTEIPLLLRNCNSSVISGCIPSYKFEMIAFVLCLSLLSVKSSFLCVIPSPSLHRYQLPFSVPTWRRLDGSSPRYPQLPQDDPLALQAVKVSWALGVHQGCDKFTKGLMAGLEMDMR